MKMFANKKKKRTSKEVHFEKITTLIISKEGAIEYENYVKRINNR